MLCLPLASAHQTHCSRADCFVAVFDLSWTVYQASLVLAQEDYRLKGLLFNDPAQLTLVLLLSFQELRHLKNGPHQSQPQPRTSASQALEARVVA